MLGLKAATTRDVSSAISDTRVTFIVDIPTPYHVAVFRALSERVHLEVLFGSHRAARGLGWDLGELGFSHRVVGGSMRARQEGLALYLSPRLLAALHSTRPQAVISTSFSVPSLYASWYCRAHGIPLLIQSDGTAHYELGYGRARMAARRYFARAASGAVGNSSPSIDRFIELGFPQDRVFAAPHASDLRAYHAVARQREYGPRPDGSFRVLACGRLMGRKGYDRLLEAIALACRSRPGMRVAFVGSGPDDARLRARAAELAIDAEFRGFIDQHALPSAYADADAFVFPTLNDTFGFVLLEAMAAGLPVIASPYAGATVDLLRDGENGLVRDPFDVPAWAHALECLADDAALRERLGTAAKASVVDRTPARTADGYAAAVQAVLRRARALEPGAAG
jgi:glycosyltransferase involved in cell wall biosynthesis